MKKFPFLFFLLASLWLTSCEDNSNSPINGYIETTEEGSSTFIFKGYDNASSGFNVFEADGFDKPFYIQNKKFVGSAWRFAHTASGPLSAMTEIPADDAWKTDIEIAEKTNFWARYNSSTKYVFVKIRVAYIQGNNVAIEYITAGSKDFDLSDNENANSPIEGKSFVTDYSMPHLNPDNYYVEHTVSYDNQSLLNYAYEWVDSKKHTAWVAFSFDNITKQDNYNRPSQEEEPWAVDPSLPAEMQTSNDQHKLDGFDRGHLCASNDRVFSKEANAQTFYYSNMSPQINSFNGGYWVAFEQLVQNWARSDVYTHVYITKGGALNQLLKNFKGTKADSNGVYPETDENGFTIHGLACPQYYFMAILAQKGEQYQAIGFWVEHKEYNYSINNKPDAATIKTHAVSIDELEEKTGLDFFCNLPDVIENQVESSLNEGDWTF